MRVILIGPAVSRGRLRALMAAARAGPIEVVGEADTIAAARAAALDVDGYLVAADENGTSALADALAAEQLTAREVQVLELLAEGLPNKAIATRLRISDQTVKSHVSSICAKLGAFNRTDAVRRAARRGLITL
jgi:ATP/maltotriose-dependent transcriptional regulator MalT